MNALTSYFKKSAPGFSDLQRKFDLPADGKDVSLQHLVITLDPTLTSFNKPAWYRVNQAKTFLNYKQADIVELLHLARVISCDDEPREDTMGNYVGTIGVWVRKEDAKTAKTLLLQQRWISDVTADKQMQVFVGINAEPVRPSNTPSRHPSVAARPSL